MIRKEHNDTQRNATIRKNAIKRNKMHDYRFYLKSDRLFGIRIAFLFYEKI